MHAIAFHYFFYFSCLFQLQVCIFIVLCFPDVLFFVHLFSAALGWFSYAPEWYESQNKSYAQREAQSVSVFVHFLQNERSSNPVDSASKSQGREGDHNTV